MARYLRGRRDTHDELWVGRRGPLRPKALHTFANGFLERGGSEGDLMRLAGWSTRDMQCSATETQKSPRPDGRGLFASL